MAKLKYEVFGMVKGINNAAGPRLTSVMIKQGEIEGCTGHDLDFLLSTKSAADQANVPALFNKRVKITIELMD